MNACRSDSFRIGEWVVDPNSDRLLCGDLEIALEPKAMAVLLHLAAHPSEVVSADEMITSVWHDRPMGDNPVYKCIAQLRKALGDHPRTPAYIATVPTKGYRLIAPLRPLVAPASTNASVPLAKSRVRLPPGSMAWGVLLVALVIAGGFWLTHRDGAAHAQATPLSLAVLPFAQSTSTATPGVSGQAIADALSDRLAQSSQLRVIAAGSTSKVDAKTADVATVARQLRVDRVLLGHVQLRDRRVAAEVRLMNAAGEQLWSKEYLAPPGELLSAQALIAREVAAQLQVTLDVPLASNCRGTDDLNACRPYLLAQEHLRSQGPTFKTTATALLKQAIAQDPDFALAHARLGVAYLLPSHEIPWPQAWRQAQIAMHRALELQPGLPEALAARGYAHMTDRLGPCPPRCINPSGYAAAERDLRAALARKPGLAYARNWLASAFRGQGQIRQAHAQWQIAQRYDPLNPDITANLAWSLVQQGDAAGARRKAQEYLQHPQIPPHMYGVLASIEDVYGRFDETLRYRRKLLDEAPSAYRDYVLAWLAWDYQSLGMFDAADELLRNHEVAAIAEAAVFAVAYRDLLIAQERWAELRVYTRSLDVRGRAEYGPPAKWPRWLLRVVGHNQVALGDYEQAIAHLALLGEDPGSDGLISELGARRDLALSYQKSGRPRDADAVLASLLALIKTRQAQGYDGYPDLTYAEATVYALQRQDALAVATLRRAVAQGWRRYWRMRVDPNWNRLRREGDVEELLDEVQRDVQRMRARVLAAKPSEQQASKPGAALAATQTR